MDAIPGCDPAETVVARRRAEELEWVEMICKSRLAEIHQQLRDLSLQNALWTDAECAELTRLSHLADDLATGLERFGR